jgi:hypothetical protein
MKIGAVVLHKKLLSNASLVKITQLQSHSVYGHKGIYSRAFQTSRPFWVKFGAGDFHVTPLSNCRFVRKNRRIESNTSFNGANDVLRVSNTLRQIWINFGTGYVRKNIYLVTARVVKMGAVFAAQIMSVRTFHSCCSIWMEFCIRDLHVRLTCVRDCVEILAEGRTLLMGMNGISFTRIPRKLMTFFKNIKTRQVLGSTSLWCILSVFLFVVNLRQGVPHVYLTLCILHTSVVDCV